MGTELKSLLTVGNLSCVAVSMLIESTYGFLSLVASLSFS